jgi:hypothetical protein
MSKDIAARKAVVILAHIVRELSLGAAIAFLLPREQFHSLFKKEMQ